MADARELSSCITLQRDLDCVAIGPLFHFAPSTTEDSLAFTAWAVRIFFDSTDLLAILNMGFWFG